MRKLVIGNWKMWGTADGARALAAALRAGAAGGADLVLCPSFIHLPIVADEILNSQVAMGAQTCAPAAEGAMTGDISAAMLKDIGCRYVIVGHSERRRGHHETNEIVAAQAECAHRADLVAIVCVGETAAERQEGQELKVVCSQIGASLPPTATAQNTVIAYEPVWAIGTGVVPTVDQIAAMHSAIARAAQEKLAKSDGLRIVYGGSVTPDNAAALMAVPHVGGVLVGRASLTAEGFSAIARAAAQGN